MNVRAWFRAAVTLLRTFGGRGLVLRLVHEARRLTGAFRVGPSARLDAPVPGAIEGLVGAVPPDAAPAAMERAERVASGSYHAFFREWRTLPTGPQWHVGTAEPFPSDAPWWKVPHLSRAHGDIKEVWEPARFGWVYDLVRAHAVDGDPRWGRAFAERLADFLEASPPFRGVQWSCGQETAIRAIALLHAEAAFHPGEGGDPGERLRIQRALAASGERIADALGYALSQRNNHGVSEAAGLYLLGLRFEGHLPRAVGWKRRGRRWLAALAAEQFAEDGWYVQHSFNYLRVALDQLCAVALAARDRGESPPPAVAAAVGRAVGLLNACIDPSSGRPPNHGANDGSRVWPVTVSDYNDHRPTLTAAAALYRAPLAHPGLLDPGAVAWVGRRPEVRAATTGLPRFTSGASGWVVAEAGDWRLFLRAGRYRSRPGHIDPLHLCLSWRGRPVVVDPGTYSYNGAGIWRNALASAEVHNGPNVSGHPHGRKGPRFLWLAWPEADIVSVTEEGDAVILHARVPGVVERRIRVAPELVEVRDRSLLDAPAEVSVAWVLHPDADPEVLGVAPVQAGQVPVTEDHPLGWYADHYGYRRPTTAYTVRAVLQPNGEIIARVRTP